MSLYIDLTEFLANPITSGIQRVVGELCRCIPPEAAIPIRLSGGAYHQLSPSLFPAIGSHFRSLGPESVSEIRRIGSVDAAPLVKISKIDTVLVPEVFLNSERIGFFGRMPDAVFDRHRFIVYDLLPLTHPQYFPVSNFLEDIFGYFRIVQRARDCSFISEYTRDTYYRRLKRSGLEEKGVVLPLGADSVGPRPTSPHLNRALKFTVVGTVEPRKNHTLILEAFEPLLAQIPGLSLVFVGNMGWVPPDFAERIHSLANDPRSGFLFHQAPDDGAIRTHILESRATVYVSPAEGYGLPPVESLWCGTPVIASPTIPSLQRTGLAGVHYVEPLDAIQLRDAVLSFINDEYANRKASEASQLDLPTWRSFTREVLAWCSDTVR